MHISLAKIMVVKIKKRIKEGDNPSVPPYSTEELEDLVDTLANELEKRSPPLFKKGTQS